MRSEVNIDALLPPEMATRAEYVGVRKAETPPGKVFLLAVLAGAFIALGAVFATTVSAGAFTVRGGDGAVVGTIALPLGVQRLLAGTVFCLGLVLVVVGGAELFTGNNLIVMAWASGKVSTGGLLRNWGIVYAGNLLGALGTAALVLLGGQHASGGGAVGETALGIARSKVELGWTQAFALGVLCNCLVCLAIWMVFSARTTVDKVAAILFPIAAFVTAGFEHCVANMYFVPYGLLLRDHAGAGFWETAGRDPGDYAGLTWGAFVHRNLVPVTLGNVVGGAVLVAAVYWAVFLRNSREEGR